MRYFVIDSEATGVDEAAKACELAWVEIDESFNILERVQSLIDPQTLISASASGVHGLVNADVEHAPTIEEFFSVDDPQCHGRKLPADAVVIGHRVGFDMRFFGAYFESPPLEVDTLRWVRRLYPESDDHKLSTCIFMLGLPRSEGAHRAMADVLTALELLKHICARTGHTLQTLTEESQKPMQLALMPFGKHRGLKFSEVPRSYLRWMLDAMSDLDTDLRYTASLHLKN